jgi:CRISPR-associated endonuclease/helicase Cas3
MKRKYYAHSVEGKPADKWQLLGEHLFNVADLARSFADEFGSGDWAYLAGLWHDLGKYSKEFQQRLEGGKKVDHATAGAQHALKCLDKQKAKLLAYTIAGHHSGLPDGKSNEETCLTKRLRKQVPEWLAYTNIEDDVQLGNLPFSINNAKRAGFQLAFFTRMIYSCLVDADYLDTEKFMAPDKANWRYGYPSLQSMENNLDRTLGKLKQTAPAKEINKKRSHVLECCLEAAKHEQGLFSLTVPTGGGKTLSSLAFALKHALNHNLKRIIYVIPYTSIIEQNAAVFRGVFGDDAVLEHHSNYEPEINEGEELSRHNLAAENWDAPLIVTTNVQFFESLFANRSSRCRRIHNIANSVVILDEAQMLPAPFLRPCMESLRELVSSYSTTIVLCTATQPALSTTDTFTDGLDNVYEITSDPARLYQSLSRVQIHIIGEISNNELSGRLLDERQVLCIVNTRKHARLIYEKIRAKENSFHLSASMCPMHRTEILRKIRSLLLNGESCRVISTQLIEAGVDIDFPAVYRAASGIDSIAQAAGRCNREGLLPQKGNVYVFRPEDGLPPGYLRHSAEVAEGILRKHDDPLSLEAVNDYFEELYWRKGEILDEYKILKTLNTIDEKLNFPFKEIAGKFNLIKDGMEPIIIPWNNEAEDIIRKLRYAEYPSKYARKAQRFTVQMYPGVINSLLAAGSAERIGEDEQYTILINSDLYRDDIGLCPEDPTFHKVESLMI